MEEVNEPGGKGLWRFMGSELGLCIEGAGKNGVSVCAHCSLKDARVAWKGVDVVEPLLPPLNNGGEVGVVPVSVGFEAGGGIAIKVISLISEMLHKVGQLNLMLAVKLVKLGGMVLSMLKDGLDKTSGDGNEGHIAGGGTMGLQEGKSGA
jgi:hypothetical protein